MVSAVPAVTVAIAATPAGNRSAHARMREDSAIRSGLSFCSSSGGKAALCFAEDYCPKKAYGVACFKHCGAGGGGYRPDFKKIGCNKNKRSQNAYFCKVANSKFFHTYHLRFSEIRIYYTIRLGKPQIAAQRSFHGQNYAKRRIFCRLSRVFLALLQKN